MFLIASAECATICRGVRAVGEGDQFSLSSGVNFRRSDMRSVTRMKLALARAILSAIEILLKDHAWSEIRYPQIVVSEWSESTNCVAVRPDLVKKTIPASRLLP